MGPWLRAKRHAYYIHTQDSDTNCVTYNIWILEELQIAIIYRFQLQERQYTIFRVKDIYFNMISPILHFQKFP